MRFSDLTTPNITDSCLAWGGGGGGASTSTEWDYPNCWVPLQAGPLLCTDGLAALCYFVLSLTGIGFE